MKAINDVENLKYRILDNKVVIYKTINASATIMREDKTFGFSYIDYNEDLDLFLSNFQVEKQRIENSISLFPTKNGLDCVHCSAMPWLDFSGHKEPVSGLQESVPKFAFGKIKEVNNEKIMNVAINVNHALVDGYHLSLFSELFQKNLNK
jgi:chloramphenicol O-acetyltransferase type A